MSKTEDWKESIDGEVMDVEITKNDKKRKGDKKGHKKSTTQKIQFNESDSEEEILKNMEDLNLDRSTSGEKDDVGTKTKSGGVMAKKQNKPLKKAGFELLLDMDDDSDAADDDIDNRDVDVDEKEIETKVGREKSNKKKVKAVNEKKTKGDKKDKNSKKKSDFDDIDKVLAELEKTLPHDKSEFSVPEEDSKDEQKQGGEVDAAKLAAQKKKEKKERQKREAALAKQKATEVKSNDDTNVVENVTKVENVLEQSIDHEQETEDTKKDDKKKKKKDKGKREDEEKDKDKEKKKGINKAIVAAMQERIKKVKEEEERLKKEEEERKRQEEEAEQRRLEQIRLEQEKKEKRKQKEAERKARLKAEGKLLTKKQKEDLARARAMLEARKAQGLEIPDSSDKRTPRLGTRVKSNKKKDIKKQEQENDKNQLELSANNNTFPNNDTTNSEICERKDEVKDTWDATSEEEDENLQKQLEDTEKENIDDVSSSKAEDEFESEESSSNEHSGDDGESVEDKKIDLEVKRERAVKRIEKRKVESEQKMTLDNLRAAIVCVLGHVDTGKTKILDKLRKTNVQDSEAGGITQQIGATNVPIDAIKEQTKVVKRSSDLQYKLPGLLIIDTPGHESFSNLRNRGSSLCDIAILVVDIMHGLEPQTIESINLLKSKKCPFIVALNKIDRLYDWQTMPRKDIRDIIKAQQTNTQLEFTQRTKEVILQFAEQGLNAALFYENPDPRSYVSLVPTSAITGEGMGNLLYLIIESCQSLLSKRLMYSEDLQAVVLEVKAIPGLGTTIDTILINGRLKEGDTIIVAGTDGPIVTQIRSLLLPQPLKELRVKNAYIEYKEVRAAHGIKIAAKDLEKAIAGINLLVAHKPDEIEICKEQINRELKHALSHIKLSDRGVYVQASTLGSLEALLEFLKTSKIPYSGIRIGPVVKRDVVKASTMLKHEPQYATILAFDVKIERDAQELADSMNVKIFQADIIYHLFDKFIAYRDELKQRKRDEYRNIAVFPCKLKILPQFVFNSRDPIVIGVMVENGIVKEGTPLCVPSKEFVDIGIVTSIESNHKQVESARKGQEICLKIEPLPGETPKMYGRHFDENDLLVSKISRQSIDACKEYFRDDLLKADWQLMVELKKLFEIL